MKELDVNTQLLKEDLFDLFKAQLKKDFEGAGANADFANDLPSEFGSLKAAVIRQLQPMLKSNSPLIPSLLYRIDISEEQLRKYEQKNGALSYEELLSELIIKRILQKVILRRTFSK